AVACRRADVGREHGRAHDTSGIERRTPGVAVPDQAAQDGNASRPPVEKQGPGLADPAGPGVEGAVLRVADDRHSLAWTPAPERKGRRHGPPAGEDGDAVPTVDRPSRRRFARGADVVRARDDVRRGYNAVRRRDPARTFHSESARVRRDPNDAGRGASNGRLYEYVTVGRKRRRQGSRHTRQRVDSGEHVEQLARGRELVEAPKDLRVL